MAPKTKPQPTARVEVRDSEGFFNGNRDAALPEVPLDIAEDIAKKINKERSGGFDPLIVKVVEVNEKRNSGAERL